MTTEDEKRRQELWTEYSKTRGTGGSPPPRPPVAPVPAPATEAPKKPQQR